MKNLYFYLASRSKQGIKLITILQSNQVVNSNLTDIKSLKLPVVWEKTISQIIYDNRMSYEPRLETANSFEELRNRLKNRGFKNLIIGVSPLLNFDAYTKAPVADTSFLPIKKTMLRKKH